MQEDPLSFSLPHMDRALFKSQTHPMQRSNAERHSDKGMEG